MGGTHTEDLLNMPCEINSFISRTEILSVLGFGTSKSSVWEFVYFIYLFSYLCVYNLPVAHSGRGCRHYLHSDTILSVPQLWSKKNEKHYRTVEVSEGAKLKLLLFSLRWNHHHFLELVTSQLQHRNQHGRGNTASVLWVHIAA